MFHFNDNNQKISLGQQDRNLLPQLLKLNFQEEGGVLLIVAFKLSERLLSGSIKDFYKKQFKDLQKLSHAKV